MYIWQSYMILNPYGLCFTALPNTVVIFLNEKLNVSVALSNLKSSVWQKVAMLERLTIEHFYHCRKFD